MLCRSLRRPSIGSEPRRLRHLELFAFVTQAPEAVEAAWRVKTLVAAVCSLMWPVSNTLRGTATCLTRDRRYRWHDSVRDDVLARLLALNAER